MRAVLAFEMDTKPFFYKLGVSREFGGRAAERLALSTIHAGASDSD